MPEINDADFELLKLAKKTLGGKNRIKQLRILREENPEMAIPELDTEERIAAEVNPLKEENRKLREDMEKANQLNALEKKREKLKLAGHSDEEIKQIEKIMVEKGIGSHETAAEFHRLNSAPAAPTPNPGFKSSRVEVPAHEGLAANPAQWARETAASVLNEFAKAKK